MEHCSGKSYYSANNKASVNTLLESITGHSVLSTRNASVAFGEYELDRFLEACLHEGDDDDNLAPVNQVSFKGLEMFIGEI